MKEQVLRRAPYDMTGIASMIDHPMTETFAARRERAMFEYVRKLVVAPETAQISARPQFHSGAIPHYHHVKAVFTDILGGREAFFYPQRVLAAFFVSNIVVILFLVRLLLTGNVVSKAVEHLQRKTLSTIFTYLAQLESAYYAYQYVDIKGMDEVWAYDQARAVRATFIDLGHSVETAVKLGVSFGYIVFVLSWFVFLADFRGMIMLARRGKFPHFDPAFVDFRYATEYTGVHISQSIITLVLFATFATLFIVPILWDLTRNLILNLVAKYYVWIIVVFLPSIIQYFANETFVQNFLAEGHMIKSRGMWAIWEIYSLISQLLAGIAIGIARWIVTIFLSAFSVARVERSSLPQWMLGITPLLDIVASKVHSMVYLTHCHNAPAMRVAAWLLEAGVGVCEERREQDEAQAARDRGGDGAGGSAAGYDAKNNKDGKKKDGGGGLLGGLFGKKKNKPPTSLVAHDITTGGLRTSSNVVSKSASRKKSSASDAATAAEGDEKVLTTKQNRTRNKFYLAVLLHRNPHLRRFRAHALEAENARKAEALAEALAAEKEVKSCFGLCGGKMKRSVDGDGDAAPGSAASMKNNVV